MISLSSRIRVLSVTLSRLLFKKQLHNVIATQPRRFTFASLQFYPSRSLLTMEPGYYLPNSQVNGQIYFHLNSGHKMPAVGLGTWQSSDDVVRKSVRDAVKNGYRLIDTAYNYQNEAAIGQELEAIFKEGLVKREELFVTTKLHVTFMKRDDPVAVLKSQLAALKLDYVDLYLIHWPFPYKNNGKDQYPLNENGRGQFDYSTHYTETWKGMEDCVRAGLARSIGISNFNIRQVEDVLLRANIRPSVLQIESHPYLVNSKLIQYCQVRGIALTAYSPFANPGNMFAPKGDDNNYPRPLEDPVIKAIAAKYPGKTAGHVILRWQVQRGVAVIPKSLSEERIKANLNIFDFTLSHDDMAAIERLDKGIRICAFHIWGNSSSRDYPFDEFRDFEGDMFAKN